jgi:hypothetical protein
MDIDYLIDRLEALIQTGKRVPLSNKVMVDEQECYALIDQMRAVIPEEIKAAKRTLNDRERILDEAEDTARQIIEQAEQERRMMIEREGLLVEAERQRDIILSEATQESFEVRNHAQSLYDEAIGQAQEMRDGANQYAMQVLQELEGLLDKHLTVVRNGLQNFIQQSQQYQQQMDDYHRQHRPQYAPSKAELAKNTNPPGNGTVQRPAPATQPRPAAANPPPTQTTQPRPPINRPNPPIERKPVPPTPPSSSAAPTSRPAAPTPLENRTTGVGRINPLSSNSLRPVPKPNNRPADNQSSDDYDEIDPDDRLGRPPF